VNSKRCGSSPRATSCRTQSSTESPMASITCKGRVSGEYTSTAINFPVSATRSSSVSLSGERPMAAWGSRAALAGILRLDCSRQFHPGHRPLSRAARLPARAACDHNDCQWSGSQYQTTTRRSARYWPDRAIPSTNPCLYLFRCGEPGRGCSACADFFRSRTACRQRLPSL